MQRTTIIYSNTVIGTLAVDGWAVTFGPAQSPPRCAKCSSPPINGQCTNHYDGPFLCGFDVAIEGLSWIV